jgi:DNA-directed RNA polymerase specialized sigma24 family protein
VGRFISESEEWVLQCSATDQPERLVIDRVTFEQALSSLEPRDAAMIKLLGLGFPCQVIANHFDMNVSQVQTILRRARRKLALALGQPELLHLNQHPRAQAV